MLEKALTNFQKFKRFLKLVINQLSWGASAIAISIDRALNQPQSIQPETLP